MDSSNNRGLEDMDTCYTSNSHRKSVIAWTGIVYLSNTQLFDDFTVNSVFDSSNSPGMNEMDA